VYSNKPVKDTVSRGPIRIWKGVQEPDTSTRTMGKHQTDLGGGNDGGGQRKDSVNESGKFLI